MYKNLKLHLGEMSFSKDFIHTDRGDLYPLQTVPEENAMECVKENAYHFSTKNPVMRLLGHYFPFATYEMKLKELQGQAGFRFSLESAEASVLLSRKENLSLIFSCPEKTEQIALEEIDLCDLSLLVTCRIRSFDIYLKTGSHIRFVHSFDSDSFANSNDERLFSAATASVCFCGSGTVSEVNFYMDCGISQADIRPIRYENGDIMIEQGKIYLTISIRMEERCYQGIFSWIPGTSQFELTGALFFDAGDHLWGNDVASSILYHRTEQRWYLWVCSFSHDHILGHASFIGDVRFGVNVVDISLMEKAAPEEPLTAFKGFVGDEDPDFYYDETSGLWHMAICRLDPSVGGYRYFFFRSRQPFSDYEYIGQGADGAETGGSFVKLHSERYFCCGNSFDLRANYRLYGKDGMQNLKCDYDDGGFRGWGTLIPVTLGSRTRIFWLTFDRHNGSSFNWSYGNLYCFEAVC